MKQNKTKQLISTLAMAFSLISTATASERTIGIAECMPSPDSVYPAHQRAVIEKVYSSNDTYYQVTLFELSNSKESIVLTTNDEQADGSIRFEYRTLRAKIVNRLFELDPLHRSASYIVETAYGQRSIGEFACKLLSRN